MLQHLPSHIIVIGLTISLAVAVVSWMYVGTRRKRSEAQKVVVGHSASPLAS